MAVTIPHLHDVFSGGILALVAVGVEVLHIAVGGNRGWIGDGMELSAKNFNASGGILRRNTGSKNGVEKKQRQEQM
jgi:hypothetical protein